MADIISRRYLLLAVGGSAALGAAALVRAADGPASVAAPSRGRGQWTHFGSVAVLGATIWLAAPAGGSGDGHTDHVHGGGADEHDDHDDHDHGLHAEAPIGHATWQDTVIVDVEVHNGSTAPVMASPGQFRLRLPDGPSVSYYDTESAPVALEAGDTLRTRISYLVPTPFLTMTMEYADPELESSLSFPLRPENLQGAI